MTPASFPQRWGGLVSLRSLLISLAFFLFAFQATSIASPRMGIDPSTRSTPIFRASVSGSGVGHRKISDAVLAPRANQESALFITSCRGNKHDAREKGGRQRTPGRPRTGS